jgi:hypothetical protein
MEQNFRAMLNFTTEMPTHLQAHFIFLPTHNAIAEKNKKSLQAIAIDNTDNGVSLIQHNNGLIEARTDNSGSRCTTTHKS